MNDQHPRRAIGRRVVLAVAALLMPLTALIGFNAASAQAAPASSPCNPVSCVWDYGSNSAPIVCVTSPSCGGFAYGTEIREGNGGQFTMACWFTGSSYTGNYTSNRWFLGYPQGLAGVWQIHSSYVYHQTTVGGC